MGGVFRHRSLGIASLAIAVAAGVASALTPAELTTPELAALPVTLTGLHDEELAYFDSDRRLRREPVNAFVRLRLIPATPNPPTTAAAPLAVIELVDGQRVVGPWQAPTAEGLVRLEGMPLPPIPLDSVRTIELEPTAEPAGDAAAGDVVAFRNGDRLTGLVTAADPTGVTIQPAGSPSPFPVPWDQVRSVHLGNPPAEASTSRDEHLLRLRDGTRLVVGGLTIGSAGSGRGAVARFASLRGVGQGPIQPEPSRSVIPLERIESIDFLGAGWQLLDLTDQPMRVSGGGEVFGLHVPPRREADELHLHGPITVEFALPEGATRVAGRAELDLEGVPSHLRDWADLLILPGAEGKPQRLSSDRPALLLNAPAQPGPWPVTIDPGVNGPILDRVVLREAVLLVRRPVATSEGSTGE